MTERLFETPQSRDKEAETVEHTETTANPEAPTDETDEGEKTLRICANCGTQFLGDPKTFRPICPKCAQVPYRPQEVPL